MTMAETARDVKVTLEPMLAARLDAVVAVEQRAYAHPWNRTNFLDALQSGYQALMLLAGDVLLGYFVAMQGCGRSASAQHHGSS
jgi:ribosomal-protein-alanine N-acetyltransferase